MLSNRTSIILTLTVLCTRFYYSCSTDWEMEPWEEPAEVSQLIAEFQFQLNIYCTEGTRNSMYTSPGFYTHHRQPVCIINYTILSLVYCEGKQTACQFSCVSAVLIGATNLKTTLFTNTHTILKACYHNSVNDKNESEIIKVLSLGAGANSGGWVVPQHTQSCVFYPHAS